MIQASQRPGFAGESFGKRRILGRFGRNDLQRHHPVQIFLARFIDRAHAAAAEQFQNFELREVLGRSVHSPAVGGCEPDGGVVTARPSRSSDGRTRQTAGHQAGRT